MLKDHERAASMLNGEGITWHHFIQSRFVGMPGQRKEGPSLTVDIQSASLESSSHAELRGLLEYSDESSLPVVFEFVGTLDLEFREVRINSGQPDNPERAYVGRFSENGRVLTLRAQAPDKPRGGELHLVHEGTLAELFGD